MKLEFRDMTNAKACANCGAEFYRDKRCTWAHWSRAKFCCRICSVRKQSSDLIAIRPSETEAFAKWFQKSDGCWEWQGAIDRDGYGIFSYARKTRRAHRVALELDGRALGDAFACHRCDNPRCVRPDHLFVGTNEDNMRDMVAKGRNPDRFGQNNPNWRGGTSRKVAA